MMGVEVWLRTKKRSIGTTYRDGAAPAGANPWYMRIATPSVIRR